MRDGFALDGGSYHFLTESLFQRRRFQQLIGEQPFFSFAVLDFQSLQALRVGYVHPRHTSPCSYTASPR